nr:CBL-interacting serine/threonine-protein kinase 24-like isoform X3 [Physcomitrium patens]|eukprot:XP_024391537.1 CBL-interacting serine/threonine-protein kinase 24-like isoform X3 [Physcomitrella patens]
MVMRKVGKYEVGRTIGEGTFAKVKFAQNTETGESVAMKVLDRQTVLKHKMVEQIKREISIMKLVRHPNVVRLHEVLASRCKIYIILEFVTGGELFDKIVHQGRLNENDSRKYFQQLMDGVDYCHSKGVSHRDLKEDGLLHTTCGTPNYVAPEVLNDKGYDGAVADIWSCGVILFVLMAGFLPFDEADLNTLYSKIREADFTCPPWFSSGAKTLITNILDPNPLTRIRMKGIRDDEWFKKNYVPVRMYDDEDINLDDVEAAFDDSKEQFVKEQREVKDVGPSLMNAFELISLSQGLNLSALFDRRQDHVKRQTRFTSKKPARDIINRMETAAKSMGFGVGTRNYKMRLEAASECRISQHLAVAIEVYEVAPSLFMIEVRKAAGDTLEYHKFYKSFCTRLKDIIWTTAVDKDEVKTLTPSVVKNK